MIDACQPLGQGLQGPQVACCRNGKCNEGQLLPHDRAGSAVLPQRPGTAGGPTDFLCSQGRAQPFGAWRARKSASPPNGEDGPAWCVDRAADLASNKEVPLPPPAGIASTDMARLKLSAGDALLDGIKAYRGSLGVGLDLAQGQSPASCSAAGSAAETATSAGGRPQSMSRAYTPSLSRSAAGSKPRRCLALAAEAMLEAREDLTQTPPPRKGFRFPSGRP